MELGSGEHIPVSVCSAPAFSGSVVADPVSFETHSFV